MSQTNMTTSREQENRGRQVSQQTNTESRDETRQSQRQNAIRPPIDVFENEQGIVLTADLPGVSNEGLTIEIDRDTLLIEGESNVEIPENIKPLYAEVRNVFYRRSFSLSSELDTDAVEANLKNGVLTLRLPKRAEMQPRKIEVKAS